MSVVQMDVPNIGSNIQTQGLETGLAEKYTSSTSEKTNNIFEGIPNIQNKGYLIEEEKKGENAPLQNFKIENIKKYVTNLTLLCLSMVALSQKPLYGAGTGIGAWTKDLRNEGPTNMVNGEESVASAAQANRITAIAKYLTQALNDKGMIGNTIGGLLGGAVEGKTPQVIATETGAALAIEYLTAYSILFMPVSAGDKGCKDFFSREGIGCMGISDSLIDAIKKIRNIENTLYDIDIIEALERIQTYTELITTNLKQQKQRIKGQNNAYHKKIKIHPKNQEENTQLKIFIAGNNLKLKSINSILRNINKENNNYLELIEQVKRIDSKFKK